MIKREVSSEYEIYEIEEIFSKGEENKK